MRGSRVEVLVDLAVAVGVVAEGDRVDAQAEQLLRGLAGDPEAAGGVLAVDDDEVGLVLVPQAGQHGGQRPAADSPDDVADEQELHCERFCQPAPRGDPDHHPRRARPGQALRRARGAARRVAVRRPGRAGGRDRAQRRRQDHAAVDPGRHPEARRGDDLGDARAGRLGARSSRRSTASSPSRRTSACSRGSSACADPAATVDADARADRPARARRRPGRALCPAATAAREHRDRAARRARGAAARRAQHGARPAPARAPVGVHPAAGRPRARPSSTRPTTSRRPSATPTS